MATKQATRKTKAKKKATRTRSKKPPVGVKVADLSRLERVALSSLVPHPGNPHKHDERNIGLIQRSIRARGQYRPFVVQAGTRHVLIGNGMLAAMVADGHEEGYAVVLDVDDDDAMEVLLLDNRASELSEWDDELLAAALADLRAADRDIEALPGWTQDEYEALVGIKDGDGALEDPPVPDAPSTPQTKPGDVWTLGDHRIVCGDSLDPAVMDAALGGGPADAVFTDPPWNVGIGTNQGPSRQRAGITNDKMSGPAFAEFLGRFASNLEPRVNGDCYIVLGASEWPALDRALRAAGFHWSATVIWVKDVFVLSRSKYHRRYEPLWYGWPARGKSGYVGGRDQDDVWEIPRPKVSKEHPTMKPVDLVARAVRNSTKAHALVFDPFLGSGTTLLAAEQLGRRCAGIEIDPRYVDVALQRWATLTGKTPVNQDGTPFNGIPEER